MIARSVLLVAFVAASSATVFACGSGDSDTETGDGDSDADMGTGSGGSETGGGSGSGGRTGTGGVSGEGGLGGGTNSETPGVPILVTTSLVLHGTMELAWQTPASTCETVEINRNQDGGDYSIAQTLIGEATEAQDSPGHDDGTFCYTITCTLNDLTSSPSNEQCVTQ